MSGPHPPSQPAAPSAPAHAEAAGAPFTVPLPAPLDIPACFEFFRRSGDDLIDRWDGVTLLRTLPVADRVVAYACVIAGTPHTPALRVTVEDGASAAERQAVAEAIQRTFVLAPTSYADLLRRDPIIATLDARYPGLRPVRQFELFAALLRCISAQQVNLRWAATTRRRLAEAFGTRHTVAGHTVYSLPAARFADVSAEAIRALQFTTRKAEYILHAAAAVANGRLTLARLVELPDEEAIAALAALRGIGRWSAEWILARTLGRPCVVAGDLAIRKVVGAAYLGWAKGDPLPPEEEIRRATAHWGASAGVAQALLLQGYSAGALAT